ncbi:MAG: phosphatidylglycerol---prolipoprotein diacylglyceryl transferase [Blastocatellia bacterium]|jgi:phosphatidylglycerol:prolipoprotein diacylglycerol transferase|nr:phosphatidylglycerol---prolipoprotein diacylglyceryl transferase [Blastocatellia bacterium]
MYPELFHIGNFPINTYGVLLALAFLSALLVAARLAARDGLPRERVYDLGLWMLLAALIGSKVLMLWTEPGYRENPLKLLSLDFLRSGGVFYGGFLGAVLTGYFLIKRYGLPWWKTADAFAPGIALGSALGRQGCFAAGCCWGKPTTVAWGLHFTEAGNKITGVPTVVAQLDDPAQRELWTQKLGGLFEPLRLHPTQLYESFAALLIFLFLLWLHRRKRFSGQVILFYAVLYGAARFTIEFFRDDPRGDILGLTTLTGLSTSQMISLVVGITGLVILIVRWRRASRLELPEEIPSTPGAARA